MLITLGLTAAASATDAAIHNKMFGFGFTKLIISNEEMNGTITAGEGKGIIRAGEGTIRAGENS